MTTRILFLQTGFGSLLRQALVGDLPHTLRFEIEEDGLAEIETTFLYRLRRPTVEGEAIRTSRCMLQTDASGRMLRLMFPDDRPAPRPPYQELLDMFAATALFAETLDEDDPRRWNLMLGSKSLLTLWRDRADLLKRALAPPFPDTSF